MPAKRPTKRKAPASRPNVLIIESRFYEDVADEMLKGATAALVAAGAAPARVSVPGVLEIPAALSFALKGAEKGGSVYDGFIALGCVVRGETSHHEHVARETMRGLAEAATTHGLALGIGILTCENLQQAWERAEVEGGDKGGNAARTVLAMIALRASLVPRK